MDDLIDNELFLQVEEHLKCSEQSWLLGAGISFDAKLPLMYPLTNKVKKDIEANHPDIYDEIITPLFEELPEHCHIEHVLSHLGDYAALAERNKEKKTIIRGKEVELAALEEVHNSILESISKVIRCGYVEGKDGNTVEEGSLSKPIVDIKSHIEFVDTLFNHASAGVHERRKAVNIFTTNYDTLLEDALEEVHNSILESISKVIRCGYVEGKDGNTVEEGSLSKPIVDIKSHIEFVDTLFNHASAGVHERRKAVNIFTTNYDTLLEDALA